ncbi:MAG: hypothetical protein QF375_07600 [Arenicellales bacterium]|nr:hypothetical protein [Arenicellales bacterium]MDP6854537.1 hypothetical protein [Arenicellales bacterium]
MDKNSINVLRDIVAQALSNREFRRSLLENVGQTLKSHGIELDSELVEKLEKIREDSKFESPTIEELIEQLLSCQAFEEEFRLSPARALKERRIFVNDLTLRNVRELLDTDEYIALREEFRVTRDHR